MSDDTRADKAITIHDVAREAGVSAMTVSNVLNGRGRVAPTTADTIREVVGRLGYRPSVAARRLRLSHQWAITMLIVVEDPDFLSDPFITAQVTGLTNYLNRHSYSLIIRGIRPSEFSKSDLFRGFEADGIVAIFSGDLAERERFLTAIEALRVPIVLMHEYTLPPRPDCIRLRQDDFSGGLQIGRHLLGNGMRRLWMLMPDAHWPAMDGRWAGVTSAVAEVPGADLRQINCGNESFLQTRDATTIALEQYGTPDAIVGGNDQLAVAAMMTCVRRGLVVPDDVQITGFNGFDFWQYVQPTLTTVKSSAHLLGERAAQELLYRLQHGAFSSQELVLPVTLEVGRSTAQLTRPLSSADFD
ncbi:hypothetical protein WH87_10740 [Devosia epidermidihirudinis]|uniref:HTH lacI-type domain-containing protein n=1 Tax=Devosia epidermidihirudinis TaxID=1293439 RepID=A0A0F5QDK4_9HYPH|nr:LacI family DNA-binding transcriptional regulator [Devosia epidermidihirudinis]KKC38084.1 hypothetical protein WH87_10740 [Devosia epidermidihirudinis]